MIHKQSAVGLEIGLLYLGFLSACATTGTLQHTHAPDALRSDLQQFVDTAVSTHPDIAYTTDVPRLRLAAAQIRERIRERMTTRAAWILMAELNPLFRDAHTGLQYPVDEFQSHRESGGAVFPVPVYVDDQGILRVADGASIESGIAPHEEIISINGIRSPRILDDAMPRMRGETVAIRRLVLEFNFAAYLWTLYGPKQSYSIVVCGADGRTRTIALPHSSEPARAQQPSTAFRYERLRPDVAYVEMRSFDISLEDEFDRFLKATFSDIEASGARKLIIDIRRNPGGAHQLSDALLGYLTGTRFRQASSLSARIHESNRDIAPGVELGKVAAIPFDEWQTPEERAVRFTGDVYLLIGRRTYSQAIVFATIFQDFNLGTVVGTATDAWANQTGQVHMTKLRHTGLLVAAPLYIIVRSSGDKAARGVQPDLAIVDNPNNPRGMVDSLLLRL